MSPYCFEHSTRHTPSECRATYAAAEAHAEKERAEHAARERRARADQIAARIIEDATGCHGIEPSPIGDLEASFSKGLLDGESVYSMIRDAALAGMEAAR